MYVVIILWVYYNYVIPTKLYRDAFPNESIPHAYKPDFVNIVNKVCIEIDGDNHTTKYQQELDRKKDKCLNFLGFRVVRFSHKQIDEGELKQWVNLNLKDY